VERIAALIKDLAGLIGVVGGIALIGLVVVQTGQADAMWAFAIIVLFAYIFPWSKLK
jgi:hypothetical protein